MTTSKTARASALMACAHAAADASGNVIRPYFRRNIWVDDKGGEAGFDPVTIADRAAEQSILDVIRQAFPDHGIIGEELGTQRAASPYKWVIDPIDGTRAFITGMPTWGTLIGLLEGENPILGLMNQPVTGERFWADGDAAFMTERGCPPQRLKTRNCATLAGAVLSSTHPDLFATAKEQAILTAVKSRTRLTRYGGDCYAYCMLAAGHIDIVLEPGLKTYDIAALIAIIERAGGRVTTWDGTSAAAGGDVLACGDPALHKIVLELIQKSPG